MLAQYDTIDLDFGESFVFCFKLFSSPDFGAEADCDRIYKMKKTSLHTRAHDQAAIQDGSGIRICCPINWNECRNVWKKHAYKCM